MIFRNRYVLCVLTALTCVTAVGCESENKDDSPRDKDFERIARNERQRERERDLDRDPDPIVARDRVNDDRRRGMQEIPADALAVEAGEGTGLTYEPSRDGVLYVYDVDDDRVIYAGRIRDRESFRLDPEGNRATINNRTVMRSDLNPRHRYRLYFDRAN
jgi:hypothetical protein